MSRLSLDRESRSRLLIAGILLVAGVIVCILAEVVRPDPPDPGLVLNTVVVVTSDGDLIGADIMMEWYGPYEPTDENPLGVFPDGGRGTEPWNLRIVINVRDPGSAWKVEVQHPEGLSVSEMSGAALEDGGSDITGRRSSHANVPAGTGSFAISLVPPDRGPGSIAFPDVHGSALLTFPAVSLGISGQGQEGDDLGQIEYRIVVDSGDIIQVTGPPHDGAFTWQRQLVNVLPDPDIWQYDRVANVPQLGPIRLESVTVQEGNRRDEFKSGILYGIGFSAVLSALLSGIESVLGLLHPRSRRPTVRTNS